MGTPQDIRIYQESYWYILYRTTHKESNYVTGIICSELDIPPLFPSLFLLEALGEWGQCLWVTIKFHGANPMN